VHHGRPTVEELRVVGTAAGLDAVGVARAEPFESTRRDLERRKAAGLDGGMAFTYKNPARSTSPQALLRNARSIVVGARSYHRAEPAPPAAAGGPVGRVGRYAWEDHYQALREGLEAMAVCLRGAGHRAAVFVDGNHLVDREAARRAGVGFYGKNTNLLLGDRGSWFVLGSLVTDAELPAAGDPAADAAADTTGSSKADTAGSGGCGPCRRCLDACPTGALPEPGVLDANRCLAWLAQRPGIFPLEFRVALHDRIYGCDDCQTVCPPNRREEQRVALRVATAPASGAWVPLLQLLDAGDDEILRTWGRWYLHDRRTVALRRNALLALGNVGDPGDGAVTAAVERHLAHDDVELRATAVWAARRLGMHDRAARLAADPDPRVRAELDAEVVAR
jgi:epoxyqueuosine reductase